MAEPVDVLPVEYRWEIAGGGRRYTAKLVEEIPPERSECLSDTMAPVEHLSGVLGCVVPWTLSAFTKTGLERKMRRYLAASVTLPAPAPLVPLTPPPTPGLGRPETTRKEAMWERTITWLLSKGEN
jgi:hypothetical protein